MFEKAGIFFLYAETPVHAGTGTSLGIVDLPIQRERITGLPMIQASSLKGVLRAETERLLDKAGNKKAEEITTILYGPKTDRAHEHAGCVSPHDARLLLFPVRSLSGVFAWTTCPLVLERFKREATAAGVTIPWEVPGPPKEENEALVTEDPDIAREDTVVLEEFAFPATRDANTQAIAKWLAEHALPNSSEYQAWREWLPRRLVILPDDAFRDFTQMATEVIARIRLDQDTKTVAEGALWSEEHLPSETLLYAPLFVGRPMAKKEVIREVLKDGDDPKAEKVLELLKGLNWDRLQIGGDETVGRGIVKVRFLVP